MHPRGSRGEHRGEFEETLRRVRAYRQADPDFESAISKFVFLLGKLEPAIRLELMTC